MDPFEKLIKKIEKNEKKKKPKIVYEIKKYVPELKCAPATPIQHYRPLPNLFDKLTGSEIEEYWMKNRIKIEEKNNL